MSGVETRGSGCWSWENAAVKIATLTLLGPISYTFTQESSTCKRVLWSKLVTGDQTAQCPTCTIRSTITTQAYIIYIWFFTALRYASAVYAVLVCLSVRSSLTSRHWPHCTKTAKHRITHTMSRMYDSPGTLVFLLQRSRRNSTGVTPIGGTK